MEEKKRFGFGRNWQHFIQTVNDRQIEKAVESLRQFLEYQDLNGKSFLDIGSGSGLFSLSAMKLKASKVVSFDYDPNSVACTQALKDRFFSGSSAWTVEQGSALDEKYLESLGRFDVVYSWGVLHHTGSMWKAIELATGRVKPGGKFYLAIYNDQGSRSIGWRKVKWLYNQLPGMMRPLYIFFCGIFIWGPTGVRDFLRHANPFYTWNTYAKNRGMSPWYDLIDWVGGYPFEVAKPEEIAGFFRKRGFLSQKVLARGGHGCNEFLFLLPAGTAR